MKALIFLLILGNFSSALALESCHSIDIHFHGLFVFGHLKTDSYITIKEYRKIDKVLTIHSDFYNTIFVKSKRNLSEHSVIISNVKEKKDYGLEIVEGYWRVIGFNFRDYVSKQKKNFDFSLKLKKNKNVICEEQFSFLANGD